MKRIAVPFRLDGGFLKRCDEERSVLALIEAMARTPHGSWAGCRHFGMRDYFESARFRPELPQAAIQEANRALDDLGLIHIRIDTIERGEPVGMSIDHYVVALSFAGRQLCRRSFQVL